MRIFLDAHIVNWENSWWAVAYFRFKAVIRDWAFSDFKWVTRASVQREIAVSMWRNRDKPVLLRELKDLRGRIK